MKVKEKICKQCATPFKPQRMAQKTCTITCAIKYAQTITAKEKEKVSNLLKEAKEPTLGFYLTKLQKEVNTLARMIDFSQRCISSNQIPKSFHGGHLWAVGSYPSLRFNLHNIHGQSGEQNVEKSGNPLGFRQGIKDRYGDEYLAYVDGLPLEYPKLKLSKEEVIEATTRARKIIRDFVVKPLSAVERMEKRKKFNMLLGIY